ncbi:hypothetical protein HPB51_024996 [Rhipicephalus microplus]|uniref:Uncharacterized protein n=1 Tax=Rhipicephalus microplus TaxID=6941 RepID=A0A9J6E4J1_RHIMP|nr:hypothetical protein HPB51_024996 [Rhipicephalus microplus]
MLPQPLLQAAGTFQTLLSGRSYVPSQFHPNERLRVVPWVASVAEMGAGVFTESLVAGGLVTVDLQEDGPPPDPNYRFLADRMREGDADGGGDRGGSRRHRDNYGGQDFDNVRHAMRQDKALQRESGPVLPPKLAMTGRQRREYEQWKSDRAAIDQERMQRHTDAEGNFTREWDLHKGQKQMG